MDQIAELIYNAAELFFVGNMVTGLFWKMMADRSQKPCVISHTFKGIFVSDRLLTLPSLLAITLLNITVNTGKYVPVVHVQMHFAVFVSIVWGLIIFLVVVNPVRKKLFALARLGCESGSFDEPQYKILSRKWMLWGMVEAIPVTSVLVLSL